MLTQEAPQIFLGHGDARLRLGFKPVNARHDGPVLIRKFEELTRRKINGIVLRLRI